MKKYTFFKFVIIVVGFFIIFGVNAFSVSNIGRVCLFSEISGIITLDGKPVANVRLVRSGDRDGPKMDEALTDKNGYFTLPAMYERTITKFLPQEFLASQKVIAHYAGLQYEIWSSVKRDIKENTESKGKLLIVSCDLNSKEKSIVVDRVPIYSLCTWDVEPDPEIDWEEEGFFDK